MTTSAALPTRSLFALAAGIAMMMVFGSLYAWSVFVVGLEDKLGMLRSHVSAVFSIAVASFTAGNFVAPMLFGRVPTPVLPLLAAAAAGAGLSLAAMGDGYLAVIAGYGGLFGFGCGLAYNTALQTGQQVMGHRPGLANGLLISAFAAGAMIAVNILADSIQAAGVRPTFWLLGLAVGGIGSMAAVLMALSRVGLPRQPGFGGGGPNRRVLGISWLGFFLGAFAGVMAIGHAAAVILHFGGSAELAVFGVTLLGLGNAVGRLGAGWLSDLMSVRSVAGIAHLTGAIGFVVVLANPTGDGAMISMVMAGLAYGMTASVYPAAVAIFLGPRGYGRNFAILLTAWGAAGLAGPYVGGYFFDVSSDYRISIEFACVASILALVNAMRLPKGASDRRD